MSITHFVPQDPAELEIVVSEAPSSTAVPHSREAEEAVCGSVLIHPECWFEVSQFLIADDFYIHRNRWIWESFHVLHENRKPIDLLTLSEELEKGGRLSEIGGSAYLTSLLNQVPTSLNAEAYGRMVQEYAIRRRMLLAANKIASLAYDGGDVSENFAIGRKEYEAIYPTQGTFLPISQIASGYYDKMGSGEIQDVISTGFIDLDDMLDGGLRGGNLMYVAGRPGMGKTGLLLDILIAAANQRKHTAIFSLEMSNEQVVQRMVAKEGIPMQNLRKRDLTDLQWPVFTNAIERISSMNIFMDDIPAVRPTQLRARAHSLYNRGLLDFLIVDYIGLMDGDGERENKNAEVTEISRSLKVLARELDIPILAAAQLNRKVEERSDKRPQLSDLRDSGSLEQDADIVAFIYRDDVYNKDSSKAGIAEINIAKQRDGSTGTVELIWRAPLMKFENAVTRVFRPNEPQQNWQDRADIGDD